VPYNPTGEHWLLISYNLKERKVMLLDPLVNMHDSRVVENFVKKTGKFLSSKLPHQFNDFQYTVSRNHVRQSSKDNSCGALVCHFVDLISSGKQLGGTTSGVHLRNITC